MRSDSPAGRSGHPGKHGHPGHSSHSVPATPRRVGDVPHDAWYAAAVSDEVGNFPLARQVLGQRVVLYRTTTGTPVALADRCVHAPVALSDGRVDGDDVVAPYSGFRYGPDGQCTSVPTQSHVPFDASVRSYPVHDDGSFVWVWPGEARLAGLRRPPSTAWLRDPSWTTFGEAWETEASVRLMQDNFADITHVAQVDPVIAPPAVREGPPPPLEVQVSETSVSFRRDYPPAPLPAWQCTVMGLPASQPLPQREEGQFVAPGLWVDRWTADLTDGGVARFVFTHALTPVTARSTRHVWRVSRDFSPGPAADGTLVPLFSRYYGRVRGLLEGMQRMVDDDGPSREVRVAADAAGSQVRRIMDRLVADEVGTRP